MMVNTNVLVPMTDANQNFSKVVRLVDERGAAIILKNNKPRYAVVDFAEYDAYQAYREKMLDKMGDELIDDNLEAFQELAK